MSSARTLRVAPQIRRSSDDAVVARGQVRFHVLAELPSERRTMIPAVLLCLCWLAAGIQRVARDRVRAVGGVVLSVTALVPISWGLRLADPRSTYIALGAGIAGILFFAVRGTTGIGFSEFFGIGDRFRMDAAFSLNVKSAIIADPFKLALAKLDLAAASGDPALTEGDNRGADALFSLTSAAFAFVKAGDLPSLTSTLSEYTSYLLSSAGMEANTAERMAEDRKALRDELKVRRDSVSGVNLDEELANMIIFQNAFNAAARLITTANEMYDQLLNITR